MTTQSSASGRVPSTHPIKLFSCDTHVEHWSGVLKTHIPEKHHHILEEAPKMVSLWGVQNMYDENNGVPTGVLAGYRRFHEVRPGSLDLRKDKVPGAYGGPKEYVEFLDLDNVQTALIHPGAAMGASVGAAKATKDKDIYMTFLQGYNNWLSDFCSEYPDRLAGAAMIPTTGVDDAIAEMKRVKNLPGILSISPGAFPNGTTSPTIEDDKFWAACLEIGMPVTLHGGISSPVSGLNTPQDAAAWIIGHVEVTTGGPYSATQLILSGVFDRFPELQFIILECGAGWLPFSMQQMDHMYERQRHWAGIKVKNPPSWYCTSGNLIWNLIADKVAIDNIDQIGVSNLTWCSDFPHGNSEFPFSQVSAKQLTAGLSDEDRHAILWGNAARFYGLE